MSRSAPTQARLVLALLLAASAPAVADTDHLWPRFAVDAGAYMISTSDEIELGVDLNATGQPIDFQTAFDLPEDKTLLSIELDWAFAERHSVELGAFSFSREGARSLQREIEIGGIVFPIGADASAEISTTSIEAAYTYWFLRNDGFGLGGSVGLVYLSIDAEASATGTISGSDVTVSRRAEGSTDLPVPMIGVAVKGAPWERVVLQARARFLPSVDVGDYSGEAGSFSLGGEVYLWGPLALGVSYDGHYYEADIDSSDWRGSLDATSEGWRFYLRAVF